MQEGVEQEEAPEIEDQILEVLSRRGRPILEDATAIKILDGAKKLSNEISEKQKIAEETEVKIDERAPATSSSRTAPVLFFCIACRRIDPMYQYSLDWFITSSPRHRRL